ncbi:multicopper oxidase domain-containing protein [Actinophytocola sp. KF-1]
MSTRGFWPMRDLPTVGWLVAAGAASLVHSFVPEPRWLMIHLLVLGAAGHAILVWSRYFADTLLRCPPTPRREQTLRLALFNAGVAVVVAGILGDVWPATTAGAVLVTTAVVWHAGVLARQVRRALGSRFTPTIRFYVVAGAFLPVGAALGTWMAYDQAGVFHDRARLAHIAVNVLGFLGLTVLGTLVTLWPTVLRTRIADGAERAARRALPLLVSAVGLIAGSALAGLRPGIVVGLLGYLAGIALLAKPALRAARAKPPGSFAAWSILAGVVWLAGSLLLLTALALTSRDWTHLDRGLSEVTPLLAAGFVAQVLVGASSYLIPVVLGGGPSPVRAANRTFDAGGPLRLVVTNAGLLVCALPVPSLVRVAVSTLVLAALASFVPILFAAMHAARRAKAATRNEVGSGTRPTERPRRAGQRSGFAVAGLAAVLVAAATGVALDPAALGGPAASAAGGVPPTGHTTRAEVTASGMRFTPGTIEVPAGDRLVITVHNESDGDVHDLVLDTGADSGRLAPGDTGTVDVGVVGRDLDGWCSVVGHRQMGMVLTVRVRDAADHATHRATTGPVAPRATYTPGAVPREDFSARDARLPAPPPERVHRVRLVVTETEQEVAPGVRQTVWTYNGATPGPVLHGRVGDRFEITLVNDGTVGHSIDFHAGTLAPDQPMRTISPGASLVYRFTATRAGIWMYHCSSMPMSAHIAAGLFGAVVIDPPDLPPADRTYVLIQSELYLGPQGGTPDTAALRTGQPDAVVFNGYPDQYDHRPLTARAGERLRLWVLDAGPVRPLSFHVVGGQFDRVWSEGRWLLGSAAAPATDTGAQVLPLLPAQGGFVELTLPEPGHYPFVNHVMTDAERGAHGIVNVTR